MNTDDARLAVNLYMLDTNPRGPLPHLKEKVKDVCWKLAFGEWMAEWREAKRLARQELRGY